MLRSEKMGNSKKESKKAGIKKYGAKKRKGNFSRKTTETDIKLSLNLDGKGIYDIDTGIPFFNHMLEQFSKHSRFDIKLKAKGDIEVDFHHLIEDTGIVIGSALKELSGDKRGIKRFGFASIPMDEALVQTEVCAESCVEASVDFSGRAFFVYEDRRNVSAHIQSSAKDEEESRKSLNEVISALNRNKDNKEVIENRLFQAIIDATISGTFFNDYVSVFFDAISKNALITLHINVMCGFNKHHIVEAVFKSAGIAVSEALRVGGGYGIPSTKGSI